MRLASDYFCPISKLLLAALLVAGCARTEPNEVADVTVATQDAKESGADRSPPNDAEATNPAEPVETGLQPDAAYPVPELPPVQLLDYINRLATMEPIGETDDEYITDQISRAKSRLVAADRIILSRDTDDNLMTAAVRAKLDTLRTLAMIDPDGLGIHFEKFIAALQEDDATEFARLGRVSRLWFEVDRLAYGQTESPDDLLAKTKSLLEDATAGESEFLAAQDAGFVLNDRGFQDEATEVLKLIGNRFTDHEQLGDEAKELLVKTQFREKVIAAMSGGRQEIQSLFLAIRDMLQDKEQLNVEILDNTLNAGQVLEFNGHFEDAGRVFDAIGKAFKDFPDTNLAKQAQLSVAFAKTRLDVIGKDIEIEGSHIDGSPFNWEKFKGKVVLVDFWATTSPPWHSSLPNLKAAYDRFHAEGFEVVGINVDRVRQNAYDYLRTARLPWPIVIDDVATGLEGNPNAIRYGVQAVPFVMLVGRDGKVADIHVRGPQLTKRIEELINMPSGKNARKTETADPTGSVR